VQGDDVLHLIFKVRVVPHNLVFLCLADGQTTTLAEISRPLDASRFHPMNE